MYKLSSIKSPRDDRDLTVSKLIKIKDPARPSTVGYLNGIRRYSNSL